jgi:hypothetical protein
MDKIIAIAVGIGLNYIIPNPTGALKLTIEILTWTI